MHGKSSPPIILPVPKGTLIRLWDPESRTAGEVIADLVRPGERVLAAKGGKGGRGNSHFATGSNRSPRFSEEGTLGEEKMVRLELRTIADVGLVVVTLERLSLEGISQCWQIF